MERHSGNREVRHDLGPVLNAVVTRAVELARAEAGLDRDAQAFLRTLWVGGGVLAGTVIGVYVWRVSQPRRVPKSLMPRRRSLWVEFGRAAVIAVASSAGRRLAERWIQRQHVRGLHPEPDSKPTGNEFGEQGVARGEVERLRALYF